MLDLKAYLADPSSVSSLTLNTNITKQTTGNDGSLSTPSGGGLYKVVVVDPAGNFSSLSSGTLDIDLTGPTVTAVTAVTLTECIPMMIIIHQTPIRSPLRFALMSRLPSPAPQGCLWIILLMLMVTRCMLLMSQAQVQPQQRLFIRYRMGISQEDYRLPVHPRVRSQWRHNK